MPDENGITPIEVLISVMLTILAMALLMLTAGSFLDGFVYTISSINMPLSIWGQGVFGTYIAYAKWAMAFPVFFIILSMVWAVKTVVKRHQYTTQQDSFYSDQL